MSSTVSRTFNLVADGTDFTGEPKHYCTQYIGDKTGLTSFNDGNDVFRVNSSTIGWCYFNSQALSVLYPNATAKPIDYSITIRHRRGGLISGTARVYVDMSVNGSSYSGITDDSSGGTSFHTTSRSFVTTTINGSGFSTGSQNLLKSSSRDTCSLRIGGMATSYDVFLRYASITFYFNQYNFSATAGDNVTSASVSSSTGYGGGSITFSCVIPTGYVFDGWYKAGAQTPYSTAQSFTYTIPTDNAANYDLALTAMAHQETHSLIGTYNGSTKAIETGLRGDASIHCYSPDDQEHEAILNTSNPTFTLSCANKMIYGGIFCTTTSLATHGKIMRSDLVLNYV